MNILAIDPGACSGWAYGTEQQLLSCGVMSIEDRAACCVLPRIDLFVIELPQIYPGPRKEDPNDQITLAVNHGRWLERVIAQGYSTEIRTPHPKEWKGSVPKKIHQPRILAALRPEERAALPNLAKSILHNAIDAVGLFLWACGRMHGGR